MLPSTGLFRGILCPHYEISGCTRPYCHFKHARKEDETDQTKPAVYTPSPSFAPTLLTISEPVKKKVKLEYTPTEPTINDAPRKFDYAPKSGDVPIYIPSNPLTITKPAYSDDVADKEFMEDDHSSDFLTENPHYAVDSDTIVISESEDIADDVEPEKSPVFSLPNPPTDVDCKKESPRKSKSRSHSSSGSHSSATHKSSHSSSSPSSSSRHKSKSSRDKDKRSDSKDKDRPKDRDKDSDRHSAKSNSHRSHSKTSSSSSSRKTSSRSENSSKTSSRSSSSHVKSSSSSSTSSSHKKRERSKDHSTSQPKAKKESKSEPREAPAPTPVYETSSDEEDIMAQCKMIFEEYKQTNDSADKTAATTTVTITKPADDDKYEDVSKKKWLAHDKTSQPLIQTAALKPNHVQNAMQSIYRRQEAIRQQQEAAAAKEAEELAKKEAEAAARKAAARAEETTLTPLIPRNYLYPSRPLARTIAPVSNILAIERAKKKVEMLRAQKQITPCQTAPKTAGRVAHNVTAAVVDVAKPAPPVLEANSTKLSYNIRMQYYNMMVEHCLNIYPSCEDAWDRAQTEELVVFKKCNTPVIYKNSALLAINKLRKESIEAGNVCTSKNKMVSHEVILAGKLSQNTSWSVNKKKKIEDSATSATCIDKLPGEKAYELVLECSLTDEQLVANGYPRAAAKPGTATVTTERKKLRPPCENERYCGRCSKLFNLSVYDSKSNDECVYHPKSTGYRRGFADHLHRCCQQPAGTPGCTYADYHISDYVDYDNLTGFVKTIERDDYVPTRKDIFALDCEMCYTTVGMELTRITVVDFNSKTVYDALVKPDNKIVDYNTTYSGISESMLKNEKRTLRDIQAVLLSMFHSKTILIGHSLESDLKALKLIHSVVVDTSVLFPHKMGPPKKRALKTLCIENLKRIIQENEHGHDSAEDAEVCIQLIKYYLRNRIV